MADLIQSPWAKIRIWSCWPGSSPPAVKQSLNILPLSDHEKREKAGLLGCPICVSHPDTDPVSPGYFCKPTHLSVFRLAHRHLLLAPLAWLCKYMEHHGLAFCTVVYHHYLGNEAARSLHSRLLGNSQQGLQLYQALRAFSNLF